MRSPTGEALTDPVSHPAGARFAWDIPRSIHTRSPPGCCHGLTGVMLRAMKFCAYIFMFFGVLGGAVVSQGIMVTVSTDLGHSIDAASSGVSIDVIAAQTTAKQIVSY